HFRRSLRFKPSNLSHKGENGVKFWRSTVRLRDPRTFAAFLLFVLGCFLFALAAVTNPLGAQSSGAQEPALRLATPIRPDTLRGEWRTLQIPAGDFQPVKADLMQLRGALFQVSLAPATSTSSGGFTETYD